MSDTRIGESPPLDVADAAADAISPTHAHAGDGDVSMSNAAAHQVNEMTNVNTEAMQIDEEKEASLKESNRSISPSPSLPSAASACDSVGVSVTTVAASSTGMQKAIAGESNHTDGDGDGDDESDDSPPGGAHKKPIDCRPHKKRRKRSHLSSHRRPKRKADPKATSQLQPGASSSSSSSQPAAAAATSISSIASFGDSALSASVSESRTHSQSVTESDQLKGSHQHEEQQTRKGKRKRSGGSKQQKERIEGDTHTDAIQARDDIAKSAPPAASSSSSSSSTVADLPIARRPILNAGRRISPRRTCYFSMLATDEVQSVMQMLDRKSLLRLARCSKGMMADADSDVSWKYSQSFDLDVCISHVHLDDLNHDLDDLRSSRLLSHMPIGVELHLSRDDELDHMHAECFVPDSVIDVLLNIPRVTKLTVRCKLTKRQWRRLIKNQPMINITELAVIMSCYCHDHPLPPGFISYVARLTRLTRLDLFPPLSRGEDLTLLSHLPLLSSVSCNDIPYLPDGTYDFFNGDSLGPALAECRNITDLTIENLNAYGRQFRDTFTAPNLVATLKRLTITNFSAGALPDGGMNAVPPKDFTASFEALSRLESLTLEWVRHLDLLLPLVPRLMSLVELRLTDSPCTPDMLRCLLLLPVEADDSDSDLAPSVESSPVDPADGVADPHPHEIHSASQTAPVTATIDSTDIGAEPDSSVDPSQLNHLFKVSMEVGIDSYLSGVYADLIPVERETTRFTIKIRIDQNPYTSSEYDSNSDEYD